MKKLIRYTAAVLVTWAVVTYAWAAFSHVSGFVGPAEASVTSLQFAANAVEAIDPPGLLGAPQRFAAHQIRQAARSAERLHGNAERTMAEFVDRLGHADAHRGDRRRHRHRKGRRPGRGRSFADGIVIQIDGYGQANDRAQRMAVIELERHRAQLERGQDRARRGLDRARRQMERAMEQHRRRLAVEVRVGDEGGVLRKLEIIETGQAVDMDALVAQLELEFEAEAEASLDKDKLKRRLEKLLDMLDKLERER